MRLGKKVHLIVCGVMHMHGIGIELGGTIPNLQRHGG